MMKPLAVPSTIILGLLSCVLASGQSTSPIRYTRTYCVKVRDGKAAEYAAFLREGPMKLAKLRVDAGEMALYGVAQSVVPAGRSARCDYMLISGYNGFPAENPSAEKTAADMKKAGINMTPQAMYAKRDELTFLVSTEIWRWSERVGDTTKGSYLRLNYFKVKNGMMNDWLRTESGGWKALAELAAKENPGFAWRSAALAMPGGETLPYNGLTVDVFPSWEALGKGIATRTLWNKAHPNQDMSAYMARLADMASRPRVDVLKMVEFMGK